MCRSSLSLNVLTTDTVGTTCEESMRRPTGTEVETQSNYLLKRAFRRGGLDVSLKNMCVETEQQSRQRRRAGGVVSESWTGMESGIWVSSLSYSTRETSGSGTGGLSPLSDGAPARFTLSTELRRAVLKDCRGVTLWKKFWSSEEDSSLKALTCQQINPLINEFITELID